MHRRDQGDLASRIAKATGVDEARAGEVVGLALQELHRISIVHEKGPTAAVMEACFSFGAEAAFHLIGIYASEHHYHGRDDDAGIWAEVAMRFIPAAYREGCDRVAPWFSEKTAARLELDTAMQQPRQQRLKGGSNASETCDICFARDRDTLIRPASERRLKALVQQAVGEIRKLEGAGLSGDDSGLNDIFEEWADQISSQHSVFFELYDDLVWSVCSELVSKLDDSEIALLAAYTDQFSDYSCTEKFIETQSLDHFDTVGAVTNQLYRALETFAVNYIEQCGDHDEGTAE